ncbi:pyrimidine 5'-nucleotidase [Methylophilaceae bacterium]|nr:pyrimidine 5'-nucleotidase [Methylophilaceae bacterium]
MKDTWIFDLDNTLHDAQKNIFPIINQKINQYISKSVKINITEADRLRQQYWDYYGATIEGLIKHHNINPTEFLEVTHTLENFEELIVPMPDLIKVLTSINGEKILYTNAPRNYTNKVLQICQIENYFDGIFSIEDANYIAKPSATSMEFFIKKYKIKVANFVDDVKENLETANQFGLSTIWLTNEKENPSYIDKKITKLRDLIVN